ncbi:MAG: hypothetical protein RLZZ546_1440 [Bacteroidota bacterium]
MIKPNGKNLILLLVLMISAVSSIHAQVPVISRTECGCLNNETQPGNGQFNEVLRLTGTPGQTWLVESSAGLFAVTSPPPPGAPVPLPNGTTFLEAPAGTYTLLAKRLDNTNYTITIVNSAGTLRFPLSSIHTCKYPRKEIIGDFGACINSDNKTYQLDMANNLLQNVVWSVSGGGSIVGPTNTNTAQVNWFSAVGSYNLTVQGLARSYPGQATGLCSFNSTEAVVIANETATALACNDLVTVTANGRCEININPEMVLEDPSLPITSYDVVLRDRERDTIIANGRINQKYINKLIEVKVVQECSGNSCWGLLKLEDKSIPSLVCSPDITIDCNQLTGPSVTGFPLSPDAIVTPILQPGQTTTNKYLVKNFDYCSDVVLEYQDQMSAGHCVGEISATIIRTWIATDISGNKSSCSSTIFIRKASSSTITFPGNYDDILGPNLSLPACGNWPKLPNGNPDPSFTGRPNGVFCMNVTVDFHDTKIPKCRGDKSFKILRKWVVTDLCTAEQITRSQTITVSDKTAPVVVAPANITVGTEGLTCASNIKLPKPTRITDCSNTRYVVGYRLIDPITSNPTGDVIASGIVENNDSTYTITSLASGATKIQVVYTVIDDCDNVAEAFTTVTIKDGTPPVPVCDQFSFVGLNAEGIGYVTTESLDDGSWDNCGIQRLEAQIMGTSTWSDKIKFTCTDAGKSFMVVLRVVDKADNTNTCMVEVRVQDNSLPKLLNCPIDITVGCNADIVNLTPYGAPTVTDLCGATIKEEIKDNGFDECRRGSITRTWTATDASGNTSTCSQVITVRPTNTFNGPTWPGDHTFPNGCAGTGTKPDDLPAGKQRPSGFQNVSCALVAVEYDDLVFQYVEGFCFKILRKWTVIDWCQYVPATPNSPARGIWTYTQVIKGQNTTPPTITKGCNASDIKVSTVDNCKALIEASASATDDCTSPEKLVWSYTLDIDNNGSTDASGNTNVFSRQVGFGKHTIKWTVTDECGNSKTCNTIVEVKDQKKPTPYCISEITTVVMEQDGTVEIWASDFNIGSSDNCSNTANLRYSFSPNVNNRSRTFTCDSLTSKNTRFSLRMYVTDDAGNQDFCSVAINVQDNSNTCNNLKDPEDEEEEVSQKANVAGIIKTESNEAIKNISLELSSIQPEFPRFTSTNDEGNYEFSQILMGNDYTITPSKNDDALNGLSTLDLVLIQRHILGLKKLSTPYKIIAADANADNKVSAADLVALRKLILGLTDKLTGTSWKFVDKAFTFADPEKPFPYASAINMTSLSHDALKSDFVAIKIGDVNDSYQKSLLNNKIENRSRLEIEYVLNDANNGEIIDVPFYTENEGLISGIQMSLIFDETKFEYVDIKGANLSINEESTFLINKNNLLISWVNTKNENSSKGKLFTIQFKVKKSTLPYEFLSTGDGILASEMYELTSNGEIDQKAINLTLRNNENLTQEFQLFQNTPNPFNNNTTIGFVIPEAGDVSFKIYDYSGKVLKQFRKYYEKGYNSIDLNVTDLNATGILFYQLDSKTHSANKKMIVIK